MIFSGAVSCGTMLGARLVGLAGKGGLGRNADLYGK